MPIRSWSGKEASGCVRRKRTRLVIQRIHFHGAPEFVQRGRTGKQRIAHQIHREDDIFRRKGHAILPQHIIAQDEDIFQPIRRYRPRLGQIGDDFAVVVGGGQTLEDQRRDVPIYRVIDRQQRVQVCESARPALRPGYSPVGAVMSGGSGGTSAAAWSCDRWFERSGVGVGVPVAGSGCRGGRIRDRYLPLFRPRRNGQRPTAPLPTPAPEAASVVP